jgi:hypothetical protein
MEVKANNAVSAGTEESPGDTALGKKRGAPVTVEFSGRIFPGPRFDINSPDVRQNIRTAGLCSLRGGEGTIIGIIIGTALLQVLQNLVNLLGIPSSLNTSVMGGVILISVVFDMLIKKRKAKA